MFLHKDVLMLHFRKSECEGRKLKNTLVDFFAFATGFMTVYYTHVCCSQISRRTKSKRSRRCREFLVLFPVNSSACDVLDFGPSVGVPLKICGRELETRQSEISRKMVYTIRVKDYAYIKTTRSTEYALSLFEKRRAKDSQIEVWQMLSNSDHGQQKETQ